MSLIENPKKYVVAFNRDRDSYQVPLALAELGELYCLVTDLYLNRWFAKTWLAERFGISHRSIEGISAARVKMSFRAIWLQIATIKFTRSAADKAKLFQILDSTLSRIAGKEALRTKAGLCLYSGYALEAFEMVQSSLEKILFVYHPQGEYVQEILKRDFEEHPETLYSHEAHLAEISINEGDRVKREILLADKIICASSFTAESVKHILGTRTTPVDVAPYGCDISNEEINDEFWRSPASVKPNVLFVGQGTQRKGLHHLIKVWSNGLYHHADLTLVVNKFDPGIAKLLDKIPKKIRILSNLSKAELSQEYRNADIFVMPSLVEGFGLVYLEAMVAGCYIVGTSNTGLPDLGAPNEVASLISAGDLSALHEQLYLVIKRSANRQINPRIIRQFAISKSWVCFRENIQKIISQK